jgi:hypothetical protein
MIVVGPHYVSLRARPYCDVLKSIDPGRAPRIQEALVQVVFAAASLRVARAWRRWFAGKELQSLLRRLRSGFSGGAYGLASSLMAHFGGSAASAHAGAQRLERASSLVWWSAGASSACYRPAWWASGLHHSCRWQSINRRLTFRSTGPATARHCRPAGIHRHCPQPGGSGTPRQAG